MPRIMRRRRDMAIRNAGSAGAGSAIRRKKDRNRAPSAHTFRPGQTGIDLIPSL